MLSDYARIAAGLRAVPKQMPEGCPERAGARRAGAGFAGEGGGLGRKWPEAPAFARGVGVGRGANCPTACAPGEPLAAIGARLKIQRSTLSGWATVDGFRPCDLKVKAEADMRKARRLLSLIRFAAPVQGRERV